MLDDPPKDAEEIAAALITSDDPNKSLLDLVRVMEKIWNILSTAVAQTLQDAFPDDELHDDVPDEAMSLFEEYCMYDLQDFRADADEAGEQAGEEFSEDSSARAATRFRARFAHLQQRVPQTNDWNVQYFAAHTLLTLEEAFHAVMQNAAIIEKLKVHLDDLEMFEQWLDDEKFPETSNTQDDLEYLPFDQLFDEGVDDDWE